MAKDLTSKDILQRPIKVATKASRYHLGRWEFFGLSNPVKETSDQTFYRIDYKFGITSPNQLKPVQTMKRGKAGEYIAQDKNGILAVVTLEEFARLFPVKNLKPPIPPVNSSLLENPKVLTGIIQISKGPLSNKPKKLSGMKGVNKPNY